MNGDHAAVRLLLEKKADVNTPQTDGATALQWAAYRDDLELARSNRPRTLTPRLIDVMKSGCFGVRFFALPTSRAPKLRT
jgi:ankyrin repeat protein